MIRQLHLVVDMYGCPNRCLHCWLGHSPNRVMEAGADDFIVQYFAPYFDRIAYYSWTREPDYCPDYVARWQRDVAISVNCKPERFELASFYRIVRDAQYIPFLRSVGVAKVQLTLFGLEATQDRYVGRNGAYAEVMRATDLLIAGGITPRWQCFINEENAAEIVQLYHMAEEMRRTRCPQMEFFVHEGSCEGENRKLYDIRITKPHIPQELIPVYFDYDELHTEAECCAMLAADRTHPTYEVGEDITLYISNTYDVFYNFTNMSAPWAIGNLKREAPEALVRRIVSGDTFALRAARQCTWAQLVARYGDPQSLRAFSLGDFKDYLFNNYLDEIFALQSASRPLQPRHFAFFRKDFA